MTTNERLSHPTAMLHQLQGPGLYGWYTLAEIDAIIRSRKPVWANVDGVPYCVESYARWTVRP
jgi:hypothetical protein